MAHEYDVWFRDPHLVAQNMLKNPDFDGKIDYAPYEESTTERGRRFQDFMSGEWASHHAVRSLKSVRIC